MFRHAIKLVAAVALLVPLVALGQGTAAASAGPDVHTAVTQSRTTAETRTAQRVAPAASGVSCNMTISATYTSPSPRLVNWTATEGCNSVIGAIAIIQSTLYYDNGQSIAIAEGTHPSQSPSYQVFSTGSASPAFGGNFHVTTVYQIVLAAGQGSWNPAAGCSYIGGLTNSLQCTVVGGEFSLIGDPQISPGGVVNGVDYSASDIHPGTTLAIFGKWFVPADTVIVTQNGAQYAIGAGSLYWYDSSGQINATLPAGIVAGQATVNVETSHGQLSNGVPITINP
jgi:hypothetical protein